MKLWYWQGIPPNFGDELNPLIWQHFFGTEFFDEGPDLFLGIGSILFNSFDATVKKTVFGSGFAGYTSPPDLHDGSWDVRFVRGPRTAQILGLDPALALADPAILLREIVPSASTAGDLVSFMPHWESLRHGTWEMTCALAGVNLIDPRQPIEKVIAQLQRSRLVITEAMHGAIVADALRVPWIPILPFRKSHRMKWHDWAESLDIELRPVRLAPSNLEELQDVVWDRPLLRNGVLVLRNLPFAARLDSVVAHRAAPKLAQLATTEPMLSRDSAINHATSRLLEEVERMRRDYGALTTEP